MGVLKKKIWFLKEEFLIKGYKVLNRLEGKIY